MTVSSLCSGHLYTVKIFLQHHSPGEKVNTKRDTYHHGDLRSALLKAAESVLAETGIEGFSLRRVAREVGVSHSAPAHHFKDSTGLLDALATEGFRQFLEAMEAEQAKVGPDPQDRLLASGRGYVRFAEASPTLLLLMFGGNNFSDPSLDLQKASEASFQHLVDARNAARGAAVAEGIDAMADVIAIWALVHGLSSLLVSGRLGPLECYDADEREAFIRRVIDRII